MFSVSARARVTARQVALASVVCFFAAASSAGAAPTPDSTPHETFFYMSCSSTPCERQMYRVPHDRRLKVFALSCAAQLRTQGSIAHIGVRRQLLNGETEETDFAANHVGVQGNTHYFAFRGAAGAVVEGGGAVDAFVDFTGEMDAFYCFLAGDLIEAQ